jgi:hypothetical protein
MPIYIGKLYRYEDWESDFTPQERYQIRNGHGCTWGFICDAWRTGRDPGWVSWNYRVYTVPGYFTCLGFNADYEEVPLGMSGATIKRGWWL